MLYFAVWHLNLKKILISVVGLVTFSVFLYMGHQWMQDKTVAVMSWAAANKVIVIDPGHGGVDPGAIGPGGTLEKNITLPIALKLSEYLSQSGAMVIMTRSDDRDLGTSKKFARRKREDLLERYRIVTNSKPDMYINIQVNSYRGKGWCPPGSQIFYYRGNDEGKVLASFIQNEIKRILQNTNRLPLPLEIYMLKRVKSPGVVIEVGFLSNPAEEKMLADKGYQNKLAYAIFSGIVRYLADDRTKQVFKR